MNKFLGTILLIALGWSTAQPLLAQWSHRSSKNNGIVRGYIIDRSTQKGITNAYVELLNYHPTISTATDEDGYFELKNIPVGHQRLHVMRDGYYEALHPQLIVAGKEAVVSIPLEEQFQMTVVTVEDVADRTKIERYRNTKQETLDPMNTVSARPVNIEEMDKYVGGYSDLTRELSNFAGLYNPFDLQNLVVSRGNSPYAFQYLVEGVPIDNFNHFPTLGATGGTLNLLNSNLLDNSDFANGSLSAEYGNAYAGMVDAKMRAGNNRRHEHLFQFGLFGIEAIAEGPFKKGGASYAVALRGGLVSLLRDAGVDFGTSAAVEYYDLNARFELPTQKMGTFSIFVVGGYNQVDVLGVESDSADFFASPSTNSYPRGLTLLGGLRHTYYFGRKTWLKTTFSYLRQEEEEPIDRILQDGSATPLTDYDQTYERYGLQTVLNSKLSKRLLFRAGFHGFFHRYDFFKIDVPADRFIQDGRANQWQFQAFAQIQYRISERLQATFGLHGMYWDLNERSQSFEPRVSLDWQINSQHQLGLSYGWHSRAQPASLIYYVEQEPDGSYNTSNRNLGSSRSHQAVLSHDWAFAKHWRLLTNAYFQYQTDIPVEQQPSSFSMVNYLAVSFDWERTNLENAGLGYNYGVEMSLERFFAKGYYGLLTGSYQRSFFQGSDQIWRPSAFDVRYIGSILAGKEFKIGPKRRNVLYGDVRFNVRGGSPYVPIDDEASRSAGTLVYETENAYLVRNDWYKRLDVRIGMRLNHRKKRMSHNFYIEIINATGAQNPLTQIYNMNTNSIVQARQIGFFPNFLYQFRF